MKKRRTLSAFAIVWFYVLLFSQSASANSSWHWLSAKKPYELLLFIVPLTLLTESLSINYIPAIHKPLKVFCIVSTANILSYLVPYAVEFFLSGSHPYEIRSLSQLTDVMNHVPFYTVDIVFLLFTLFAELPLVYLSLRKDCNNKRLLMITIIISNIVTTALCALSERLLCYGAW